MQQARKPVLQGNRVRLRPLTANDAQAMFESLSEPISMRLTGTHGTFTFEDVLTHCRLIEKSEDRWDYGIEVDGDLVGEIVLNGVSWPDQSASLRIAVWTPGCRNKGYGSEAAALLIRHGFEMLALNRIELEVFSFNPHAQHVYEKLGFRHEGVRREALIWDGEKVDAHVMSLLRREYLADARDGFVPR
ncbi:MAG: GNAT family N-acetyltransferase [Hyphomicrobiales bacterium]|nr:GNAT family N-acetyltransferase [Hyphomicrobiales bacterium]